MFKARVVNGSFAIANVVAGYWGKNQQMRVFHREIPYEWYMGHLTDFCWSSAMVSLGAVTGLNILKSQSTALESDLKTLDSMILGNAAFVVAGTTFVEYLDSIPRAANFDWQDVACYALGTNMAYGVYKASRILKK